MQEPNVAIHCGDTVAVWSESKDILIGPDFAPVEVQLEYEYDALGRLIIVTDPTNGNRDYDYDAAGNRTTVTVEN